MNPILKKLGFDERDRVAIIHADDIGMCQATLPAIADLFEFGLVSSAAVMAPCPWFPQAAAPAVEIRRLSARAFGGDKRSSRRLIATCARHRVSSGTARKMAAQSK